MRRLATSCLLLASLLAGCSSGAGNTVFTTPDGGGAAATTSITTATPTPSLIDQASVSNPATSTQIAPPRNLDPFEPPQGQITSVEALQANYEIVFGQLSAKLGVTRKSTQYLDNVAFIKSQPATGFFDLTARPIAKNAVGVTGTSFETIAYDTTVTLPTGTQTFHVSGGLIMPVGIDKTKLRGVVVYFHGTQFDNANVGSSWASVETQLTAELFASQGYVVVIPDYIGQGIDYQDVHPYVLYPQVSAKTACDMLNAVRARIVGQYGFLGGEAPLKLFSAGYSEGGAYSVWFNAFVRSNPGAVSAFYALTHSVGMEGAYSVSQVIYGYLFDNVAKAGKNTYQIQDQQLSNIVKPLLAADAMLSYTTYDLGSRYDESFNREYFDLDCGAFQNECNIGGQHLDIAQAFALQSTNIADQLLFGAFGKTSNGTTYPGIPEIFFTTRNSAKPLVTPLIFDPRIQQGLMQTMRAADVDLTALPDGAVSIFSLALDSVVSPNCFDYLTTTYPTKLRTAVAIDPSNLLVVSPLSDVEGKPVYVPTDHLHGLIYEFIYALNTFNQF